MHETKIGMKLEEETKSIKKICEQLGDSIKHEFDKGIENVDTEEMKEAIDMLKDLYEMKKSIFEACYYKQIMEAMEESEYGEDYDEEGPLDEGRMYYRGQPRSQSGRFMSRGDGRRNNRGRGSRGRRSYEEMYPMTYPMTPEMYHMPMDEWNWDRDMDREGMGRMYYSEGNRSGSSDGNRGGSSSGNQGSMSGSQGGSSSGMSGSSGSSYSGGSSRGYSEGYSDGYSEGRSEGQRNNQRDKREGRSGQSRRSYMESKEMGKEKGEKMKNLEEYMRDLGSDISELIQEASPEEKTMMKSKMSAIMSKIN